MTPEQIIFGLNNYSVKTTSFFAKKKCSSWCSLFDNHRLSVFIHRNLLTSKTQVTQQISADTNFHSNDFFHSIRHKLPGPSQHSTYCRYATSLRHASLLRWKPQNRTWFFVCLSFLNIYYTSFLPVLPFLCFYILLFYIYICFRFI